MVFTETRSNNYWSKDKYIYVKKLLFFFYSEVIIIVWSTLILGSLSMSWGKKLQPVQKLRLYIWLFHVIITLKDHLGRGERWLWARFLPVVRACCYFCKGMLCGCLHKQVYLCLPLYGPFCWGIDCPGPLILPLTFFCQFLSYWHPTLNKVPTGPVWMELVRHQDLESGSLSPASI